MNPVSERKAAIVLLLLICFGTNGLAEEDKELRPIAVSELTPEHDGQEVVMSFRIAGTYWISGGVPKGQPRSFGITPVVQESDPRFSVLVSGDLADVMERFGFAPPSPGDPASGLIMEAQGKIRAYPPPESQPEKGVSYKLVLRDWKQFRFKSPLPTSDKATSDKATSKRERTE